MVTTLPPLSEREAQQLLKRRYPNQFSAQARKELAGLSQGSPKRLVDLAYRVAEGESIEALKLEISENGKKFAKLLEGLDTVDCLLVQELADHGPTGPWDERLLIRFGWERSWAARRLNGLVGRGILIKSEQAHSGPGRPRTLYALADGD